MDATNRNGAQMVRWALFAALCVAGPVAAALLPISNVPLFVVNTVKPNIMYTLDNSGSMQWNFMPDQTYQGAIDSSTGHFYSCYWNSGYNDVYYDPTITYQLPVDATGAPLPATTFTSAALDGYTAYDGGVVLTINLSTAFADFQSNSPYYYLTATGGQTLAPASPDKQAAFYYEYTASSPATPAANICYPNSSYTKVIVSATSGPGGTDERQNFANWFTYYRTRLLMTKSALGAAFSTLNAQYRVGFSTINTDTGSPNTSGVNFLNINDFTSAQKTTWFHTLYSLRAQGGTPLQAALQRDGIYYQTGVMPGAASSSTDPVQYSCQQNFTVLSTDGFWNAAFSGIGDQDNTIPVLPDPVTGLTAGQAWPRPIWEGPTATSNTLADVAMYYWDHDLRTSGSVSTDNVPTSAADPASWQHMTTFTIGLGAQGQLAYPTDLQNIINGTLNWPVPTANALTTIDDLWHAAVDAHGQYLSAKNPALLTTGLDNILNTITSRSASIATLSLSSVYYSTNTLAFAPSFNTADWSGQLLAYPILSGGVLGTSIWDAATTVTQQNFSTGRTIITDTGSASPVGVPFVWASLSATEQADLNTNAAGVVDNEGSARLNYIRGDQSNEGTGLYFRPRLASVLGDIVNSAPVYVGGPDQNYPDNLEPTPYSQFAATYANREPMVYVGANDGMLHGFDATATLGGEEKLAYVPSPVFGNLSQLTATNYTHHWYVDGSPTEGDAYWGTGTASAWHSVLVGGLNGGGEGYYALDVTNPVNFSQGNASSLLLWDFTRSNDADLGDTYDQPSIVLMANGDWAAVVGNGYNSTQNAGATGHAVLYILNISTGAIIKKLDTGYGSLTAPDGLSTPAVITGGTGSNVAAYIYAGDIDGNMWKFDVTSTNPAQWGSAYTLHGQPAPLYSAEDSSGNPQPITEQPQIGSGPPLSGYPTGNMVYFGTGSYFLTGDTTTTNTQTFYGIWDNGAPVPSRVANPSALVAQTITTVVAVGSSSYRVVSSNPVNYTAGGVPPLGWYLDLPAGERSVSNSILTDGRVIFVSIVPATAACAHGGVSWLNELDGMTGGQLSSPPFDVNGDGSVTSADVVPVTGGTAPPSGMQINSLVGSPALLFPAAPPGSPPGQPNGVVKLWAGVRVLDPPPLYAGRLSWEQLQ